MPLSAIEATILAAHRAAVQANRIAEAVIRVSIRKRIEAGEALAEAREFVPPDDRPAWLTSIGLTERDAHRYSTFHDQLRYACFDSAVEFPDRAPPDPVRLPRLGTTPYHRGGR
jgi:hypothetical protein